jgi:hypothetical protein
MGGCGGYVVVVDELAHDGGGDDVTELDVTKNDGGSRRIDYPMFSLSSRD